LVIMSLMQRRLYLDNELITYILRILQGRKSSGVDLGEQWTALEYLISLETVEIELLFSDESLAEIRNLHVNSKKRKELEPLYFVLKQGKAVVRNAAVTYSDRLSVYGSPDISYNHPNDDTDLKRVKQFLASKGNMSEFDARYIANALLPENRIDVFLTYDKATLWCFREEIKRLFGVVVKLPTEEAEYLKCIL
jgi:hypothetical protein